MSLYARDTEVGIDQSKREIERTIMRYGASGFVSGWSGTMAQIGFEMQDRRIRFALQLPSISDPRFTHEKKKGRRPTPRSPHQAQRMWDKACRQKWRSLTLLVKAKLEAVESGIQTFEEEFLTNVVLPTGLTIGETLIPSIQQIAQTGQLPPLLPAPPQAN